MLTPRPCTEEGCGQHIVFLKTEKGSTMPVDAESLDSTDDESTLYDSSRHVNHWGTCTKPDNFRRDRKPKWKYAKLLVVEGGIEIAIGIASDDRIRVRFGEQTYASKVVDNLHDAKLIELS